MAAVLVIGYGNPLRSDDGVGLQVAEAVRQLYTGDDRIEVLTCHQLVPELAAKIAESDQVIFVDAAQLGAPGELNHKELNPELLSGSSNHRLDPASLLRLSQEVYGRCPKASLLTVSAGSLTYGQALTKAVEQAVPAAVRMLAESIERWSIHTQPIATDRVVSLLRNRRAHSHALQRTEPGRSESVTRQAE